jgi:hypothetical protein
VLSNTKFEFEVTEHHPDGSTTKGRIDLHQRQCFVLESKQFQAAKAAASQLELAAQEAGVIEKKKSSHPVRGIEAWDECARSGRGGFRGLRLATGPDGRGNTGAPGGA